MTYEVETGNLLDVPTMPDLSSWRQEETEPWGDGWYQASILATQNITKRDGTEVTFRTEDLVSQNGDSRNLFLRVAITRKSDGRVLEMGKSVNYKHEYFTASTLAAIQAAKDEMKEKHLSRFPDTSLFPAFSALTNIGTLQRIAGIRQFQRTTEGGLDLTPIIGKTLFVRLAPDRKEGKYKDIADFSDVAPKRKPLL